MYTCNTLEISHISVTRSRLILWSTCIIDTCIDTYSKREMVDIFCFRNALGYKIVGCPVSIGDTKYQRNALMFNLCFVFGQSVDTSNHEPVVKKLASYLTQIEVGDQQ
jgi:hypothetical protein